MALRTTNRISSPVNYSKVNKPRFEVFEDYNKVYQDEILEYSSGLTGVTTASQAKASVVNFDISLTNFKIKRISLYLVESPNVAGSCDWNNISVKKSGSLLVPVFGLSSSTSTNIVSQNITGFLEDTIIDGTIRITATGTPVDTGGVTWLVIDGFQL